MVLLDRCNLLLLSLLAFSRKKLYWKGMNEVILMKEGMNFEEGSLEVK